METIVEAVPAAPAPPTPPVSDRRRAWLLWVVWVALSWLGSGLAFVAGAAWVLPPVVLLLTAGLLRSGRTLLDRLMFATAALLGAACAAGLLFAAWPFGLAPVPAAGTALTVLGTMSALTGRRPRWPRPSWSDALSAATAVGVWFYVAVPYLRTDSTGRLALLLGGEDHARHVTIFDTIRRIGGYAYLRPPDTLPDLWEVLRYYPSGWHLTAGLLDGFARSSAGTGDPVGAMDHYTWFVLGTYGLFALALVWAAQWIAGPLLGWWRLPLVAFLAVQLVYSDLAVFTVFGFPSQLFGLTLLVLVVAVLSRGGPDVRETAVVAGALLVALGFGYELYLPSALLAVGIWTLRRRQAFVLVTVAAAGALSVLPIGLGLLLGGHSDLVAAPGGILPVSRAMALLLALVLAAALIRPRFMVRLRVWRSYVMSLCAVLVLPIGFLAYRIVTGAAAPYYSEKAWHGVVVVLLAGAGAVCLLLPRSRGTAPSAPAALLAAALVVSTGAVVDDMPGRPGHGESISRQWHSGKPVTLNAPIAEEIVGIARRHPARPGTITVVLTGEFLPTYLQTLYVSTLQRTGGVTDVVLYGNGAFTTDPARFADTLARTGKPILLVVTPAAGPLVAAVRRHRPDLPLTVVPS